MTVYADILVLVNLYIDFFLLWAVKKLLGLRARGRRLALGALAGGLLSLTALARLEGVLSLLLGLGTALAVTAAAFTPLSAKRFAQAAGCFWLCSLGLAGLVLEVTRLLSPRGLLVLGNVLYLDLSPAVLFFCTAAAYAALRLTRRLLPESRSALDCRWITVRQGDREARIFTKADTGNQLREPFSGLPVIVCQADALGELAPAAVRAYPEAAAPPEALRLVPYTSLGGNGVLPAFRPDAVLAGGRELGPCYVALCPRPLSAGQYQALADPALLRSPS